MADSSVEHITKAFSSTDVEVKGVSFKGKSLKLDKESDCKEIVESIAACKHLEYLNLEGNTLGVDASKAISKALETKSELKRALWKDMFTGRMKEEIPRALEYLGNGLTIAKAQLTELDLSDNAFGPIGVSGLANLLSSPSCYQLQELKLNNNGLGISGGKMLAEALLRCHKNSTKEGKSLALKLLIIGRNRLENEGATALAEVFETLGTLEEISMPQNGIYHKGIKALSNSFKKNHNLKVLDLNDNTITKVGANHIAAALPHLQKLKILNLGDCLLGTDGATVLAKALTEKHDNLEELHLGFNEIKSEGGLAVTKAMANKNNLKKLNINGNQFGANGRALLKEDLKKQKRLSALETLRDDDSCDEGESEHNNEDEDNEEETEENKTNGFSFVSDEFPKNSNELPTLNIKSQLASLETDDLSNFLKDLSFKAKAEGPLKTFLENPTGENLLKVKEIKIEEFINKNQDYSVDFYVDTFIPLLVKISSLSVNSNEEVKKFSSDISQNLYKNLFKWATDKSQLATVNNALFVYLGLIKSEEKNFKINWDLKGSMAGLHEAISGGIVPLVTQETLKLLMEKESKKQTNEEIVIT